MVVVRSNSRHAGRGGEPASARPAVVLLVLLAILCGQSWRQARTLFAAELGVFIAGTSSADAGNKPSPSFTLPSQATDVKDAISEFQRLVEHEAWEKAFKSLETISSQTTSGFIEGSDGVLRPSRLLLRSLLAALPPAGKNAYRLFYDAQAAALWDQATGKEEADKLASIVNKHLISSVGDRAADRLGDFYFERGDWDGAVGAWQSLWQYCPESKISKPQTLVKLATALSRAGRWNELNEIEPLLRKYDAAEPVEIGGRRVPAGELVARLVADSTTDVPRAASRQTPADIELPSSNEPLWQFRYQSKHDPGTDANPFQLMDVYGRTRANDFPIAAAVDEKRIYINLFGVEMGFDLASGKLLWRTGRLHQLQLQQNRQSVMPEHYRMVVSADRTWSVTRDPQQVNQHPPTFWLVGRESATGKELVSSRRTLSGWNIMGAPCVLGDVIYVGGHRSNQGRELSIL
ncbi:MAG TPA: hypothetical protein VHV08_03650, partial [Pirellulales bacterium]|nr:hypothetical protein [Pirellulales bacterium]